MKRCKSYPKYKGIYPPRCGKGKPCEACVKKYEDVQADERRLDSLERSMYGSGRPAV